ncbi:MAG: hypothetical protein QNK18_12840 [Gammaproteobacteria bacterium]|nr:hypothetical protein [Gammaproteobacteria bacterium]
MTAHPAWVKGNPCTVLVGGMVEQALPDAEWQNDIWDLVEERKARANH